MDLAWIRSVLAELGLQARLAEIRRAEAAARVELSRLVEAGAGTEGPDSFEAYLGALLRRLDPQAPAHLSRELARRLRPGNGARELWSQVLPGVREALERIGSLGLKRIVVSNSDGGVEARLARVGLAPLLEGVIDSQRLGVEKPDPAIFVHALRAAGTRPERSLHVGDLLSVDVRGAQQAGIHALLLDPYGDWQGADCERAPDLDEVSRRLAAALGDRRPETP